MTKVLKANRGIREGKANTIITSYKHYKQNSNSPVKKACYIDVCNKFMMFLRDTLIEEGRITFPNKLGTLMIVGKKIKIFYKNGKPLSLAPDWKATKDLWEEDAEAKENKTIVYHENLNTDGVRYKTRWFKTNSPVLNKNAYNFILARQFKRAIAKKIKEGKEYTITNYGERFEIS